MGVYTDGIHLVADDEAELHEFAAKIGLKRQWFQDHKHKHYDLFGGMVESAIAAGAVVKDTRHLVNLKLNNDSRNKMATI